MAELSIGAVSLQPCYQRVVSLRPRSDLFRRLEVVAARKRGWLPRTILSLFRDFWGCPTVSTLRS